MFRLGALEDMNLGVEVQALPENGRTQMCLLSLQQASRGNRDPGIYRG